MAEDRMTPFHHAIKALREELELTQAQVAKAILTETNGMGDRYGVIERNDERYPITTNAEKIIDFLLKKKFPGSTEEASKSREAEKKRLRGLAGYDAPVEEVLDYLTKTKVAKTEDELDKPGTRRRFGEFFSLLRVYSKLTENALAEKAGVERSVINTIINGATRTNALSEVADIIRNGFGIEPDSADASGISVIKRFYAQAKEAERVLEELRPSFGLALGAHKMLQGGTKTHPNMSDKALAKRIDTSYGTLSSYQIGLGVPSLEFAEKVINAFNSLRDGTEKLDDIEMVAIPEAAIAVAEKKLGRKINPKNLDFVSFVEVGLAIIPLLEPKLRPKYSEPAPENVRLHKNLLIIKDFLGIETKHLLTGVETKNHDSHFNHLKSKRRKFDEAVTEKILKNLDMKTEDELKETATAMLQIKEFNEKFFNHAVKINLSLDEIGVNSFKTTTGLNSTQNHEFTSNYIRRIAEYFTAERKAEVASYTDFIKAQAEARGEKYNPKKPPRFNPDHFAKYTAYNQDETRREINAEVISGLPAEVIFYDRAVNSPDVSDDMKTAWALVRDKFIKICNYRNDFLHNHPEATSERGTTR